jgi:hypothetical protein
MLERKLPAQKRRKLGWRRALTTCGQLSSASVAKAWVAAAASSTARDWGSRDGESLSVLRTGDLSG